MEGVATRCAGRHSHQLVQTVNGGETGLDPGLRVVRRRHPEVAAVVDSGVAGGAEAWYEVIRASA